MPSSKRKPPAKPARPAARATSYKLDPADDAFIRAQLAAGTAQNASQIVRAAMREYRETSELRAALHATLEARLRSRPDPRSVDAIFDEVEREVFGAEES